MVTGTFAFPSGYPTGPATWPPNLQNPHTSALVATDAQSWASLGYDSRSAIPSHSTGVSPELSGYLHSHGKARDGCRGTYLQHLLQARDVDVESSPPMGPVTAKAAYANHGVVKINNVGFLRLVTSCGRGRDLTSQESMDIDTLNTDPLHSFHSRDNPIHHALLPYPYAQKA